MPIYEYKCENCGVFEVTQRITEDPLTECPTCKSSVHRQISHTSFVLKGSGWYATDYAKSGSAAKTDGAESSANAASTPATSSNSESAGSNNSSSGSSDSSSKPSTEKSSSAKPAE